MSFPYNATIPQPGDNPSNSQGLILQNFTSIGSSSGSWTTVDHYGFGTGTDGTHKQITFSNKNTPGSLPTDPSSIIFTKNNLAGFAYPFFLNGQASMVSKALPFLPDLVDSGFNHGFKIGTMAFNFGDVPSGTGTNIMFAIPMVATLAIVGGVNNTNGTSTATFSAVDGTKFSVKSNTTNTVWYFAIGTAA